MVSKEAGARRQRLMGKVDPEIRGAPRKAPPLPSEALVAHLKEMFWDVAGSPTDPPSVYQFRLGARSVVEYLEGLHSQAEED